MNLLRLGCIAATLGLALLACSGGSRPASMPTFEVLGPLGAGDPLPPAELARLDGSGVLATPELAGTPAVLNLWATWCPACVEEMPDVEEVHRELRGEVRFIGINREDNLERARTLAEATGVTYELVVDTDGRYFRELRGRGMPLTVFVGEDGRIAHRHAGPLASEALRELIRVHLGR